MWIQQTRQFPRRLTWVIGCGLACFFFGCGPAGELLRSDGDAESPSGSDQGAESAADGNAAVVGTLSPEVLRTRGATMGTYYQVTIADPPESLPEDWQTELDLSLRRVNDQMSTYLASSEITRFNESLTTDWFAVSPGFARVVKRAIEIGRASEGALDITVGPLVNAWSFGPGKRRQRPPDQQEIDDLRETLGYERVQARLEPPAIRKEIGTIRIDLSAIAKGYGVDVLLEQLRSWGCEHAFVDIGGENRAMGQRGTRPWRVAIEDPNEESREYHLVFDLTDQAIATSGDYRNYFEFEGKRYSHTIDPRTGRPVEHGVASVSVFAEDCMTADAWATALNVLGVERGMELAEINGLAVRMVERVADERFESFQSPQFPKNIPLGEGAK